jgi:type I restriction enzyme R subunit
MRRDPRAYLWDALAAVDRTLDFTRGRSLDDYLADAMLRSAVERQFEIVGEALSQLAKAEPSIAQRIPDIGEIVAFRYVLIHGYAAVDRHTVWRTVEEDLASLRNRLGELLSMTSTTSSSAPSPAAATCCARRRCRRRAGPTCVDKPLRGHGLMQAIARVNRVFRDKPGGLVVDCLGLADERKQALATYTESGGTGKTAVDQAETVALMLEKHEVRKGLFHGFGWSRWVNGTPPDRLSVLPRAQEHILAQQDGRARLLRAVTDLSRAFALAVPHEEALRIRDDVGFFQAVRAALAKVAAGERKTDEELDHAIRQIVSKAVASGEVVDIFSAAGLRKPDISIRSDEFLAEVRGMPQRNLAVELLRKLLSGEIKSRARRNVVQGGSFAELLEQSIRRYQNRAIETAQVIEELIALAKDMRAANARGESLRLTEDELAFYDALEANDSAVKVLGEPTLLAIARKLASTVRSNVTIDWTVRENVRAQLRVLVKRILRQHGYPPDKQEKATQTVLEQAEALSEQWAAA